MKEKLSHLLLFVWMVITGLAALTLPVFAAHADKAEASVQSNDLCGWAVGVAIGILIIGTFSVLIVVHKKRNR